MLLGNSALPQNHLLSGKEERETDKSSPRIVTCRIDDLRPHPSYSRHHLVVPIAKISRLVDQGEQVFREPLTITRDGIIIDGYARWGLARHFGRLTLPCLEYHLSEAEALQLILRAHQRSNGLNAFNRIVLALDLESEFQERARLNQQIGGQHKGSKNTQRLIHADVQRITQLSRSLLHIPPGIRNPYKGSYT